MIKLTDLLNESVNDIFLNETKINDYIKEIDSAGNRAALEAKIAKCEEAINERKKKIDMSESLEEMKDMVDSKKVKILQKEVAALEKSKMKYETLLEKMINKGKPQDEVITEDDPEVKANIDDEEIEGGYGEGAIDENQEPEDEELDDYDNFGMGLGVGIEDNEISNLDNLEDKEPLNESFIRMQSLAGINKSKKK